MLKIRPKDLEKGEKWYIKIEKNKYISIEIDQRKDNKKQQRNKQFVKTNTYKSKTGVTSIQITGP